MLKLLLKLRIGQVEAWFKKEVHIVYILRKNLVQLREKFW